ncbi:MAG: HEAT repeat domain-containing protein [Candidatus Parabeggiatoa sp.]|nr:HEAT repeat domain-containing protein [Candidatus Parabeggiatoa sp.]
MTNRKQVIETLCHLTSTGDEADRCYASRALGALGDTSAIPALVQCLRDEDLDVSIDAAEALGRIGNPSAIPPLLDSLTHDPNGEVKTAVVKALGQIGGTDVITPLLEITKSCPEEMDWDDTEDWDAWWDMQLLAVEALGRLRVTEAIPVLASILGDEEGQAIESEVLTAFALIGGEGNNVLIQRLTSGSPRERRRAATALGLSKSPEVHKAVAYAMTDREGEVRVAALRALGKLGASHYIDIMLRYLKDPDPLVRSAAIEVTADLSVTPDHVDRVREKLVPLLTDASPAVRAATLTALRCAIPRVSTPQDWNTLDKIRQCLSDQDNTVVSAACTLLAHLGDHTVLTVLLEILSDQEREAELRSIVATALGMLGNTEAVGILSWAIKDDAQQVRLAALNALMQLEKRRESEVSKPTNADAPSPEVQATDNEQASPTPLEIIIASLKGKIEPPKASTPDVESAKVSTPSDQAKITPDDAQPLIDAESLAAENLQATEDSETPTIEQRPAMSTLEAIAMDNAEAALLMNESTNTAVLSQNLEGVNAEIQEYMAIAQENIELGERLFVHKKVDVAADVRHLSARILGNSDRIEAFQALIEALNDDDLVLCREAAESLGHIADRSPETNGLANALGSLATLVKVGDNDLRLACTRALGTLGNRSAIPVLFAGLQDDDASVRTQTIQSLTRLIPTDAEQRQQIDVEMASEEINRDTIIAQFVEMLHDASASVRKVAAAALATLRYTKALDLIIDAAFMDGGATARDMGKVLRILDAEQNGAKLLKRLESVPDSIHRRFVIEMLEEVFTT